MKTETRRDTLHHCASVSATAIVIILLSHSVLAERISLDRTKTGVYRALAQLIFQSFQKNDMDTAATLGHILDQVWDRTEETGEHGLNKTNPKLFKDIDEAMDAFIEPVIHYDQKAPDPAAVQAAFNTYLDKLKVAD